MLELYDIRCDYRENPQFLNNTNPGFFWKLKSDNEGVFQKAYRLIIDGVYDSGRVESDASVQVECEGILLNYSLSTAEKATLLSRRIAIFVKKSL